MILLTGFEKFGKSKYNLSELIVKKFPDHLKNLPVFKLIIPVSWNRSKISLIKTLKMISPKPSIILLTGIHERKSISIEERAINFKFGIDEDGRFKCNLINYTNNFFLKTNVNLKFIKINVKNYEEIKVSNYPGLYICNYLYYYTLSYYKKLCRVLFVHLPNSGDQIRCIEILKTILTTINMYNE